MIHRGLSTKFDERERRTTNDKITRIKAYFVAKGKRQITPVPDLIEFAMAKGMLSAEITRIRWDDIDSEHKTVIIRDRKDPKKKIGNHQTVPLLSDARRIVMDQQRTSDRIFPFWKKRLAQFFRGPSLHAA